MVAELSIYAKRVGRWPTKGRLSIEHSHHLSQIIVIQRLQGGYFRIIPIIPYTVIILKCPPREINYPPLSIIIHIFLPLSTDIELFPDNENSLLETAHSTVLHNCLSQQSSCTYKDSSKLTEMKTYSGMSSLHVD